MIRASHPFHADPRFLLEPFEPAYLDLHRAGALAERVTAGLRELEDCCACPRNCHVNRMENQTRVCHTGRYARVASAFAHFGEEDCLRGWNGSGTIFFSLCNLRCVFCQNWDISQQSVGSECPPEKLAELMLDLQHHGCHNINFVTPEHVVPQVLETIAAAIPRGLRLPIVYNTSAYDSVDSLRLLDGIVDIYMPAALPVMTRPRLCSERLLRCHRTPNLRLGVLCKFIAAEIRQAASPNNRYSPAPTPAALR